MIGYYFKKLLSRGKFNSKNYWEERYSSGGNSGDGSYGRLSDFKAAFINEFLCENSIKTAIELGCGDGHQLSMINYASYTGMDVSETIIDHCKQKFASDQSKAFMIYKPSSFHPATVTPSDLALSLDVIYHIVEEEVYLKYLEDLFGLSSRHVIIYSTNFDDKETEHVLHRKFTSHVEEFFPEWRLMNHESNPYPGNGEQESMADFFVFKLK